MIVKGNVFEMKPKTSYKSPNKWLLDAVKLSVESERV